MATRRNKRSNTSRTSSRTRSSSRPSSKSRNNPTPVILAFLLLGGMILAFSLLGKKKGTPPETEKNEAISTSHSPAPKPEGQTNSSTRKNRASHTPPSLSKAESLECDRLYAEAKQSWNEALKIKDTNRAQFVAKRNHAGKLIEQLIKKIQPILDWEEEATMNDWPIPYEVNDLMRRFNKWSKLQATVHRMSSLKK